MWHPEGLQRSLRQRAAQVFLMADCQPEERPVSPFSRGKNSVLPTPVWLPTAQALLVLIQRDLHGTPVQSVFLRGLWAHHHGLLCPVYSIWHWRLSLRSSRNLGSCRRASGEHAKHRAKPFSPVPCSEGKDGASETCGRNGKREVILPCSLPLGAEGSATAAGVHTLR